MHKFRKQKLTLSGTCSDRTIAAKIGLVVPGKYVARSESGKMARVLCDKLQEMKGKYSHFERRFQKKRSIFITISTIYFSFFAWLIHEVAFIRNLTLFRKKWGAFLRTGRLIERGVYLTN